MRRTDITPKKKKMLYKCLYLHLNKHSCIHIYKKVMFKHTACKKYPLHHRMLFKDVAYELRIV